MRTYRRLPQDIHWLLMAAAKHHIRLRDTVQLSRAFKRQKDKGCHSTIRLSVGMVQLAPVE